MPNSFPPTVRLLSTLCLVAAMLPAAPPVKGDEPYANDLVRRLSYSLTPPAPVTVEATRREAIVALDAVRRHLAERALGVVLHDELGIDTLAEELAMRPGDAAALQRCQDRLRRVLVGGIREPVSRLRASLGRLVRLVRLTTEDVSPAHEALRVLAEAADMPHSGVADDECRQAFRTLSASSPDRLGLTALRRRISVPNASTTVSGAFVEAVSRKTFDHPVRFRTARDGATIDGRGSVTVRLHATAPPSEAANRITLHASGMGSIDATADRRRVHVRAAASPAVTGAIDVDLRADRIAGGPARVDAVFQTRLSSLGIDGLVGRCRIVQRLAADAVGRALATGDATVAKGIESEIAERIDEEGHDLAHRINGLLHRGLWDPLVSLDEVPEVHTWNDSDGLHASTYYGHDDDLGARVRPPAGADDSRFAVLTRLHESALNNTLDALGGMTIDENTIRGVWEVQLKLESENWKSLPPGREPSTLTLAAHESAVVRFRDGVMGITLRLVPSGAADGDTQGDAVEVGFHYRIERDHDGIRLLRSGFVHHDGSPPAETEGLDATLGLFFPDSLVPMRRYRPSGFSGYLRTTRLDLSDGWLTVGAASVGERGPSVGVGQSNEVSR